MWLTDPLDVRTADAREYDMHIASDGLPCQCRQAEVEMRQIHIAR